MRNTIIRTVTNILGIRQGRVVIRDTRGSWKALWKHSLHAGMKSSPAFGKCWQRFPFAAATSAAELAQASLAAAYRAVGVLPVVVPVAGM